MKRMILLPVFFVLLALSLAQDKPSLNPNRSSSPTVSGLMMCTGFLGGQIRHMTVFNCAHNGRDNLIELPFRHLSNQPFVTVVEIGIKHLLIRITIQTRMSLFKNLPQDKKIFFVAVLPETFD